MIILACSATVLVAQQVMQLPASKDIFAYSSPSILRLQLINASSGALLTVNTYWLSDKPDVMDWNASNFYRTPCKSYTDYTGLCNLPAATVTTSIQSFLPSPGQQGYYTLTVNVQNTGSVPAYFVRLRLRSATAQPGDHDILPVLWSDNYVILLKGEQATLTATVPASALSDSNVPQVVTEVYNNVVKCE